MIIICRETTKSVSLHSKNKAQIVMQPAQWHFFCPFAAPKHLHTKLIFLWWADGVWSEDPNIINDFKRCFLWDFGSFELRSNCYSAILRLLSFGGAFIRISIEFRFKLFSNFTEISIRFYESPPIPEIS